jgi:multidrug resistance efflux pump
MVVVFGILVSFLYWVSIKDTVHIENSNLEAPIANISPTTPGMLNAIYVKEGDEIKANSQLALVGSEILYSKNGGIVTSAPKVLGSYYSLGQTVVSIVDESQMIVVGSIEETKGLEKIEPGQRVIFTVDTFSGNKYEGIVDSVSSISKNRSRLFYSDKRAVKKFEVKYVLITTNILNWKAECGKNNVF